MTATVLLGTQGWNHSSWEGPFYPIRTPERDRLAVYGAAFSTVEVGTTFHAVPSEPVMVGWRSQVPDGFLFSLKVPQEITHERRLVDCGDVLTRFCRRAALLGPALGPLVAQLSPDFRPSLATRHALEAFLADLPADFRWAIEFRHPAWLVGGTLDRLAAHRVALVLADGRWIPRSTMLDLALQPTTDFAYVRWIGSGRGPEDFSRSQIDRRHDMGLWAAVLERLSDRVDLLLGYFSNQYEGHGPHSVRVLERLLGGSARPEAVRQHVSPLS